MKQYIKRCWNSFLENPFRTSWLWLWVPVNLTLVLLLATTASISALRPSVFKDIIKQYV